MPTPPPSFAVGDIVHGFRIEEIRHLTELDATGVLARHEATGLALLSIELDDPENAYALVLHTPPTDSTGVAHILEHAVLAGSEKYPVRDAFNELNKGSMNTFLNAFTAGDYTAYPVCATVPAEYWNLASVYTDLVFRPRLLRTTFLQEGHHLRLDDDGRLTIGGIVYNLSLIHI